MDIYFVYLKGESTYIFAGTITMIITILFFQVQCLGHYRETLFILAGGLYQVFLDSLKLSSYH